MTFTLKNVKQGHKLELTYLYARWIMHMGHHKYQNGCQSWPEKPLILEVWNVICCHGNKMSSSNCGAHLAESQELKMSDTNWPRYLFSSYLIRIWVSV